jgi:hypothetical protein
LRIELQVCIFVAADAFDICVSSIAVCLFPLFFHSASSQQKEEELQKLRAELQTAKANKSCCTLM